jgi:uncharacterized Tic20 family protein
VAHKDEIDDADNIDDAGIKPPREHRPAMSHNDDSDADEFDDVRIDRPPENRSMAVWSHWAGFLAWIVVPMIFYLMEKDKRSLVAWHAREALNFQISITIYYLLPVPLACLLFIDPLYLLLYLAILMATALFELVVIILASLAASRGQRYRCPLTIPFVPRPSDPRDANDYYDRE